MPVFLKILVAIIALEHLFIAYVEMFAWETKGPKMFSHLSLNFIKQTKQMAGNQGLYNLFLVAGMIWAICLTNPAWSFMIAIFFLACVAIAGIYGAITVEKSIFFKQAFPSLLVMILVFIFH